jgi:hypothetical protein
MAANVYQLPEGAVNLRKNAYVDVTLGNEWSANRKLASDTKRWSM